MFSKADSEKTIDPAWAWAPFTPDAVPWDIRMAAHLYRRAGFGATWQELQNAVAAGPQKAVDRLVRPPAPIAEFNAATDGYEGGASGSDNVDSLRAWWLRRMIETPHPLLEKMTLFWHSHFGISRVRVGSGGLLVRHVRMLRQHALGSYRAMLAAAVRDPAVLVGLDAAANRKARTNPHLGRQLLEQYSVGPGAFTDRDAADAARAFTGWFVQVNELRYYAREFDDGPKTILGQTGPWSAEDAARVVLQPAAARHLVRKLYRWLISETEPPSDTLIAPLADSFAMDFSIGPLVETMLRSNLFFSPTAYQRRVKSPVEFAVGIVRALEGSLPTLRLGADLAELGQNLYAPPTVKGWEGGTHWINTATMMGRANLAAAMLADAGPYEGKLNPAAVAQRHGHQDERAAARFLAGLLLPGESDGIADALASGVTAKAGDVVRRARDLCRAVASLPEFQRA